MAGLVIGIYPNSDAKALESALSSQQIDLNKVKVLASDGENTESSSLTFVDVITDEESNSLADDMTRRTGIIPDSGGTSVPGLGGPQTRLESFEPHIHSTRHHLNSYGVPEDEVDNFDEAIGDGRAVVLYPDAGADEPKIAASFKAAGLQNVRSY